MFTLNVLLNVNGADNAVSGELAVNLIVHFTVHAVAWLL